MSDGLWGFSHSILVTKIDFIEIFHNRCDFSMKLAYNSVSDISTKFTRFGVSLYTCNSDFAVEYGHTSNLTLVPTIVTKARFEH